MWTAYHNSVACKNVSKNILKSTASMLTMSKREMEREMEKPSRRTQQVSIPIIALNLAKSPKESLVLNLNLPN